MPMKGVTFLNDETNRRRLVQINLRLIDGDAAKAEDLIDLLIAESRKDDEKLDWTDVKKRLLKPAKR